MYVERHNERGYKERFFKGLHLKLDDLEEMEFPTSYLYQTIPRYPEKLQFQVSYLRHDTNFDGCHGIMTECGFKKLKQGSKTRDLVWWSLDISRQDISRAEYQYLRENYVYHPVKPFLHKFTSSPAFLSSSRLGNFRFRMSIPDLLQTYQNQFCDGREPHVRIFETVVYKQEVMYSILFHGPDAEDLFIDYPRLQDTPDAVCVLHNNTIIWRAQAISETHRFRLSSNMKAHWVYKKLHKFYMWDHIGVAFHVPHGQIFSFSKEKLFESLTLCKGGSLNINKEEFVQCDFDHIRPE